MGKSVAIIILNYNTKHLATVLAVSLLKQDIPSIKKRIFIIDNGSSDGSKEYLKMMFQKEIYFQFNEQNLGFTKGINQGINIAKTHMNPDYYLLLNSDLEIKNILFLEDLIEGFEVIENCGSMMFHDSVIGADVSQRLTWVNNKYAYTDEGMLYCVMIPSSTFNRIGTFDERFWLHCSDSDFQIRIRQAGMKVGCLKNDGYVRHVGFQSSRTLPNIQKIIQKDREKLQEKWYKK